MRRIKKRLAYLRRQLRAGRMSYGELSELQSLTRHIPPGDFELLEAAGVPEEIAVARMAAYPASHPGWDRLIQAIDAQQ